MVLFSPSNTKVKEQSLTESFVDMCEKITTIKNPIVYTEASIPVFRNDDRYFVDYDMLVKCAESNDYSIYEAFTKVCEVNNISIESITVIVDPDSAIENDTVEEMYAFITEAWSNAVDISTHDNSGKSIDLHVNGLTMTIKVKNIDKQIARLEKGLQKNKDMLKWWQSLSDEQKRSERTKAKVVTFVLFSAQLVAWLTGAALQKSNPALSIAASVLSIVFGAGVLRKTYGSKSFLFNEPEHAVTDNGEKIYKNTDDYIKRMIDMDEKAIKALEDYKKKNKK